MELVLVVVVVAFALGFDYTNGFHDAANAIATSVSTRALTPRAALLMAAVFNLVGAMLDPKQTTEWVDLLSEQRVVADDGVRQVIYQRYGMSWPVADRDMVLERTVRTFPEKGLTTIHLRSVTHPDAPEVPGVVRAEVDKTYLAFQALPGGRTQVEVEAFTDPMGIVPTWLVNLVQKNWARNSITALAGVARKGQSADFEPTKTW